MGSRTLFDGVRATGWKSIEQTAGDTPMSNKSKIAATVLILGTASAALATHAFAANNYDSSDWAPMYAGPTVGNEPTVDVYTKHAERPVPAPKWQLSHRTDRPR
jgi:hypothetical protein